MMMSVQCHTKRWFIKSKNRQNSNDLSYWACRSILFIL